MATYRVFTRARWKKDDNGEVAPNVPLHRGVTILKAHSREKAREVCAEYNAQPSANTWESRKAEFERVG